MGTKARFDELTDHMRSMGYVTTREACDIIGRAPSGTTNRMMESLGVKTIRAGRIIYWRKDDLSKVPPVRDDVMAKVREAKTNRKEEANSAAIAQIIKRLASFEIRLAVIESYMHDIFTVKNENEFKSGEVKNEEVFELRPPYKNDQYE
jgi:hypothetical protein